MRLPTVASASMHSAVKLSRVSAHNLKTLNDPKKNALFMMGKRQRSLYLCSDVYLLADVFEKFRSDSQVLYGLEPAESAVGRCVEAQRRRT